jgi:hypothetical protein
VKQGLSDVWRSRKDWLAALETSWLQTWGCVSDPKPDAGLRICRAARIVGLQSLKAISSVQRLATVESEGLGAGSALLTRGTSGWPSMLFPIFQSFCFSSPFPFASASYPYRSGLLKLRKEALTVERHAAAETKRVQSGIVLITMCFSSGTRTT